MGQKWPKFSFFSAEMTGTQVKSVKIVDPNQIQLCHAKKTKFPPKKSIFRQFLAKNEQNCEKIGETANFDLIVQKNENFFQKSGSVQLLSNTVPSFNWKEKKFWGPAKTTPKKVHIFPINSIFPLPRRFPSFLRNLIKLKF